MLRRRETKEAGTYDWGQFWNSETIESRYQTMDSEDSEDFICAVVTMIFGVCTSLRPL
jgi:hypothetical protein